MRDATVRDAAAAAVIGWCRRLAECSEQPGVTTRTFLSPPTRDVHAQLGAWMERLGIQVSTDAAGNLRGVFAGEPGGGPRLFIGSHLDTVPHAGAFDGILGVVLGIALIESLGGRRLPYDVEVVGFSDEEGVRFGTPFIGSRAFAGCVSADLLERRDAHGRTVADAIRDYGLDPGALPAARAPEGMLGYLEFHIEQGPVLEREGLPLAVVEAIAGQSRLNVEFAGAANHAGTTPMGMRRDALAGAAEWIGIVERDAAATPGLVATVGRIDAFPGAGNVIAGACRATLDVRHAMDDTRSAAVARLLEAARDVAARRRLDIRHSLKLDQPGARMADTLVAALERCVMRAGYPLRRITSGAGHDAMIVANRMPAAMLFVRSPGGISHHPDESVDPRDVAAALDVGRHFLDELAAVPRA